MPFGFCLECLPLNGISGLAVLIGKSTVFKLAGLKPADGATIDGGESPPADETVLVIHAV
jgi:hypothetical protein